MWDVLIALIGALAPLIIPLLLIWIIVTHWQQINNILQHLAQIPGTAIGSAVSGAVTPLVIALLAGVAGLGVVGVAYHFASGAPAPSFPELAAPATVPVAVAPSAAATGPSYFPQVSAGYTGGGFSGGARLNQSRSRQGAARSSRLRGGARPPTRPSRPAPSRSASSRPAASRASR